MKQPPARHKTNEEMSVSDWIEFQQTGQYPESPAYLEARRRALADAGLEPDPGEARTADPKPPNPVRYRAVMGGAA